MAVSGVTGSERVLAPGAGLVLETFVTRGNEQYLSSCLLCVRLDLHSTTVTQVVEGCAYIRRRFKAFKRRALSSGTPLSAPSLLSVLQCYEDKNTRQTARFSGHLGSDSTNKPLTCAFLRYS